MGRLLSEAAKFVVNSIASLGLNVQSGSRFDLMYKTLHNPDGTSRDIKPDDPNFGVACEALRDITQLEYFFDVVDLSIESRELRSKVIRLINDTVLPQGSTTQSPGRDVQAELFVFAACRKAGLNPTFQEPDIVCLLDHQKIAVAVKRIKNLKQLVKRIREGASQIKKAGGCGIVFVDVVIAMNPRNYRAIARESDVVFGLKWMCLLRKVINGYHDLIQKSIKGKNVLAVILHDHWIRMDLNKHWGLETMTYRIPAKEIDSSLLSYLDIFSKKYLSAFPNLTKLTK